MRIATDSLPNRRRNKYLTLCHLSGERRHLPGRGAVPVKNVEVLAAEQLAPIDAGLNGSEAA